MLLAGVALGFFFPDLIPRPWLVGIGATFITVDLVNTLCAGYRMRWTQVTVTTAGVIVDKGKLWHRRQFIPARAISSVITKVGPVDRFFHHVSIAVVSAAREITLPPLGQEDGQLLAALVEELANDG